MKKVLSFMSTIKYCLNLSWKASKFYTIFRIIILFLFAIIPFISLNSTKTLLNLLSANEKKDIIIILIIISFIVIANKILFEISVYIQNTHSEILEYKINEKIMSKTLSIDIEFFDAANYLNVLQSVLHDSASLNNIIWNIFNGISCTVSLLISFIMLSQFNIFFSFSLLLITLPIAFISKNYSKVLYNWKIKNLINERKLNYIKSICNDKKYSFDIRVFGFDSYLIKSFKSIKDYCISNKKKLTKKSYY